jgi:hypothetical protein
MKPAPHYYRTKFFAQMRRLLIWLTAPIIVLFLAFWIEWIIFEEMIGPLLDGRMPPRRLE